MQTANSTTECLLPPRAWSCLSSQAVFLLLYGGPRRDPRSGLLLTPEIPGVAPATTRDARDILGITAAFARDAQAPPLRPRKTTPGHAHIHDGRAGRLYSVTCVLRPCGHCAMLCCASKPFSVQVIFAIKPRMVRKAGNGIKMVAITEVHCI